MRSFIAFGVATAICAVACSSSSHTMPNATAGDGAATDGAAAPAGAQACQDTANAVANASVRCMLGDYTSTYDGFVQSAANGSCSNILDVRDSASLYGTCIPSFTTISCADLQAGNIDATCNGQLLHSSFQPKIIVEPSAVAAGAARLSAETR